MPPTPKLLLFGATPARGIPVKVGIPAKKRNLYPFKKREINTPLAGGQTANEGYLKEFFPCKERESPSNVEASMRGKENVVIKEGTREHERPY